MTLREKFKLMEKIKILLKERGGDRELKAIINLAKG